MQCSSDVEEPDVRKNVFVRWCEPTISPKSGHKLARLQLR